MTGARIRHIPPSEGVTLCNARLIIPQPATPLVHIVIPGGTGQVGAILARAFVSDGHTVTVLSRRPDRSSNWRTLQWDGDTLGPWVDEFNSADVVINLAGRTVNCRYNAANQQAMMNSRLDSTRVVGEAISSVANPPRLWLQASTATIYAHRLDAPNDEYTGLLGGDEPGAPRKWNYSATIARNWEAEVDKAVTPNTRKVKLRSAMTMSPDSGGIFDTLLGLTRRGLGGTSGSGRQFVSWIHDYDFIQSIYWIIEHEAIDGPVNLSSPNPIPNSDFMRVLRKAWGTRIGLSATALMLEVGALFMRTETELVLKSRRVVPTKLTNSGFAFRFPEWAGAAQDLCRRWRQENGRIRQT